MNVVRNHGIGVRAAAWVLLGLVLSGCATVPKIDWNSRVGTYTYEQSVVELGPPDKYAKLSDGSTVAEWLVQRGYTRAYAPPFAYSYYGFYGPYYGGFFPGYMETYTSPSRFLRLIFDPQGILRSWTKFYR